MGSKKRGNYANLRSCLVFKEPSPCLPHYEISADELLSDRAVLSSLAGNLAISNADVQTAVNALQIDLSADHRICRKTVETTFQLMQGITFLVARPMHSAGIVVRDSSPKLPLTASPAPELIGHSVWTTPASWTGSSATLAHPAMRIDMVAGRNSTRKLLICLCSTGRNYVVVTEFTASVFTTLGRLDIFWRII